jgi:hypothetical protein
MPLLRGTPGGLFHAVPPRDALRGTPVGLIAQPGSGECPPGVQQVIGLELRNQTSSVTVPPTAVIFSLAEPETASTVTCSATEISP